MSTSIVRIPCPLCSTGTVYAAQKYHVDNDNIPVWYASCNNNACIASEGGEVMGTEGQEFPVLEWLEEFGVYWEE